VSRYHIDNNAKCQLDGIDATNNFKVIGAPKRLVGENQVQRAIPQRSHHKETLYALILCGVSPIFDHESVVQTSFTIA